MLMVLTCYPYYSQSFPCNGFNIMEALKRHGDGNKDEMGGKIIFPCFLCSPRSITFVSQGNKKMFIGKCKKIAHECKVSQGNTKLLLENANVLKYFFFIMSL